MVQPDTEIIVGAFKARHGELSRDALAAEARQGISIVMFETNGYVVAAHYEVASGQFIKLVASPHADPLSETPSLPITITPADGEVWQ
ncbi:MAG: hypothetical protein WAU70_11360 [Flavobacteriales bacterium]